MEDSDSVCVRRSGQISQRSVWVFVVVAEGEEMEKRDVGRHWYFLKLDVNG